MIEATELVIRQKRQTSFDLRPKAGRPPEPLFTLSNNHEAMQRIVSEFSKRYFHEDLEKFIFEKLGVGKARVWAMVYLWLAEEGYIIYGDNVVKYHKFLSECLPESVLVVWEQINRNVKKWEPLRHQMYLIGSTADVDALNYSNTTKKLLRQYFIAKTLLCEIQEEVK